MPPTRAGHDQTGGPVDDHAPTLNLNLSDEGGVESLFPFSVLKMLALYCKSAFGAAENEHWCHA